MWNVIKEIELELARRQWKATDFVMAAHKMDIKIDNTMISDWRRGKRHPNAKSRENIRKVFAANPPTD